MEGDHASGAPPSASSASPPAPRRASAASISCANSSAAGMRWSRRVPSRASPPSGIPAAGQLPLPDPSRPTPPAHPPPVRGRRSSYDDEERAGALRRPLVREWGLGGGGRAQGGRRRCRASGGIGGHRVLTLALLAIT